MKAAMLLPPLRSLREHLPRLRGRCRSMDASPCETVGGVS